MRRIRVGDRDAAVDLLRERAFTSLTEACRAVADHAGGVSVVAFDALADAWWLWPSIRDVPLESGRRRPVRPSR